MNPLAVYGKPWCDLTRPQQIELLGYELARSAEENPKPDA